MDPKLDEWSIENIRKRVKKIAEKAEKNSGRHIHVIGSTVHIDWEGFFKELNGRK